MKSHDCFVIYGKQFSRSVYVFVISIFLLEVFLMLISVWFKLILNHPVHMNSMYQYYTIHNSRHVPCRGFTINVRGGISSWHHPEVKESDTSFWNLIHKTSPKSHYAKLQIPPTFYWQSTDQNYTIDFKIWSKLTIFVNLHWMANYV